jgi:hypothetical protein
MEASGPLSQLGRSEEVVVREGMEWRRSSASPTGEWAALGDQRRSPAGSGSERVAEFVRGGKYISQLSGNKRAQFGRRFDARGSSDALESLNEENQKLKAALYEITTKLQRATYTIGTLEAQIKRLSEKK